MCKTTIRIRWVAKIKVNGPDEEPLAAEGWVKCSIQEYGICHYKNHRQKSYEFVNPESVEEADSVIGRQQLAGEKPHTEVLKILGKNC